MENYGKKYSIHIYEYLQECPLSKENCTYGECEDFYKTDIVSMKSSGRCVGLYNIKSPIIDGRFNNKEEYLQIVERIKKII